MLGDDELCQATEEQHCGIHVTAEPDSPQSQVVIASPSAMAEEDRVVVEKRQPILFLEPYLSQVQVDWLLLSVLTSAESAER